MPAIPGMEDYPIKLGTLLFTMVEPEKGREVEYNRWYEHDHPTRGAWSARGSSPVTGSSPPGG